jgi:hypothetical protein
MNYCTRCLRYNERIFLTRIKNISPNEGAANVRSGGQSGLDFS